MKELVVKRFTSALNILWDALELFESVAEGIQQFNLDLTFLYKYGKIFL